MLYNPAAICLGEHVTRWYGDEPDTPGCRLPGAEFPRSATVCTMAPVDSSTCSQLVCSHLDAQFAELRARSVTQLTTWLDPCLPQVVLGDFNAEPSDKVLCPLADVGLRHALAIDAGGTFHGFTGRTDGPRIDHILVNDDVEVLAWRIEHSATGERLASDHWPIVADVRLID